MLRFINIVLSFIFDFFILFYFGTKQLVTELTDLSLKETVEVKQNPVVCFSVNANRSVKYFCLFFSYLMVLVDESRPTLNMCSPSLIC